MLTLEVVVYILSLAFQVSGAVLLIIKYWGRTRERIVDEYFPGSNFIDRDENNNVRMKKEKVQKCAQTIYGNRMAFVFISVGYILSIFGATNEARKSCILSLVIISTIIIILLEKGISVAISKKFYKKDIEMPYSNIKDIADTVATNSEIDALFPELKQE